MAAQTKSTMNESVIEDAALGWLERVGWTIAHGWSISPDGPCPERIAYMQVVLDGRLKAAISRVNPHLPKDAIDEAFRKILRPEGPTLEDRNRFFHRMLVDGITVEYRDSVGEIRGAQARVLDFDNPDQNDFLAVNQFAVCENKHSRRADILLFINGLPLTLIELKNAADENTTIWTAYQQIQTYKNQLPTLFSLNEILVISDGVEARVGTITAGREWYKPWRTISGDTLAVTHLPELQILIEGLLSPIRLLGIIRDFVVFEDSDTVLVKKIAGYHQFHAVQIAMAETLRAAELQKDFSLVAESSALYAIGHQPGGKLGDRRIGVIWHTQGSGKSLTMAFYAGRVIREPAMENPTIVVLTDRNDLDDQLFATFSRCRDLLRQPPVQASSRTHLRELLSVQAGGVVFTTIHKFFPEDKGDKYPTLSPRKNIVVIADEAHRSQYDFIDGYARHMRDALPHASFIGFTGTPIELEDANTRAVFGNYISVYDIERAVKDGATVPIYYESRLAKLALNDKEKPHIDSDFEEATEGEEIERKEKIKTKWSQLEAVVGADKRIELIAKDILQHIDRRFEAMAGKVMIVCMSRRICVKLYRELVKLRPAWAQEDDEKGALKVIMTGSASDALEWQEHIRNKDRREALAIRFRDSSDPFKIVIVRDMWLTGFDAPSLHTMYLDKPMRGHGLMQAIARVNRVFKDKPGGLVVDYLGLARELKEALATYTESGGTGRTAINQEEAVAAMLEKYEQCQGLLHGFDWSLWTEGTPQERLSLLPIAQEHVLSQDRGKDRFVGFVRQLSRAFALAVPHEKALSIRDDVAFFQAVQAVLSKRAPADSRPEDDINEAVQRIISRAVAPEGVMDIFSAAGLKKPDISILSDEFLAEVKSMPQKNLAVELLRKLLAGEIRMRGRKNLIQGRSFSEMLEGVIRRYQNRAIEAAQVIEELIALAKEMKAAHQRGEALGLSEDELAFYDALEINDSAVAVLGDPTLRMIAQELVKTIRANVTIDWTVRENVRAQLRVLVKRILRKYGYPPDKQEKATQTVIEQAALLSQDWAIMS